MLANRTGAVGFVDTAINHFHSNLVKVGAIPLAFANGTNRIASSMLSMQQMLIDVLEPAIELRFANPCMDDALRYRAVAIESAMLSRHGLRCIQGSLHNV